MKNLIIFVILVIILVSGCANTKEIDKCEDRFNKYNYYHCEIIADMYNIAIPYIHDQPHHYNLNDSLQDAYSTVCSFGWNSLLTEYQNCKFEGCLT